MRIIAIAIAFMLTQAVVPAVASSGGLCLSKAQASDLSAAKKKTAKKKKKEKVQYMRSAS